VRRGSLALCGSGRLRSLLDVPMTDCRSRRRGEVPEGLALRMPRPPVHGTPPTCRARF
jgi:hypothetical protein